MQSVPEVFLWIVLKLLFVLKHSFYYYSGVVRPFDQEMIAIEKSFFTHSSQVPTHIGK